jgi:phosphomannomutase
MESLPRYFMAKRKAPRGSADFGELTLRLQMVVNDAEINTEDGLKFNWSDRWVHIRTSNTEPIVRIYAEAPTQPEADRLAEHFVAVLSELTQ